MVQRSHHSMAFRNYILLFTLMAGVIAGPINIQDGDLKCAKTCTESLSDNEKFQYTPGHTYTYTYEGTTETKLQGASSQTTTLKIQAEADIEVLSKCEWALKLRDISLSEDGSTSPSTTEFKRMLEANTLRFGFQDGRIDDVCPMSAEDDRVLNIKKGVLSAFQNSMDKLDTEGRFTETDVSGRCQATYTSKPSMFSGITITKSKDLLSCTERNGNISSIHSERYNVPSKIQSLPLTKSTHECEQHIKNNMLDSSRCTEVLTFRPFSSANSGAVTTATQVMTYKTYRTSTTTAQGPIQRRTDMLFQHNYDESIDAAAKSEVIALLKDICDEVSDDITKDTPVLFGALISKMKKLNTDKMMQVYTAINNGRICTSNRGKQFFFDAIPFVATEAALSMTEKLISDNTVHGPEAELWLTQLAFIPRPTYQMLRSIKPLLSKEEYKTKAMLSVSAMVHKICEQNSDCLRNSDIADFVAVLNANIGSDCSSTTPEQRETILITLKAIGNAGNAMSSSSIIGRCVNNKDLDDEVRVSALQAYRRLPCTANREDAMRLFQNAEIDAELRINAFLACMSCPSSSVLTKVKMMLSGEPVNQVGSFVWTYLENLKETASPLKQDLSAILKDAKLREDFNIDVRKFSRNIEKSIFSEYLNAGAQAESNVIFSQKSYIPRSMMMNLTVDMFGNSVNLLEVGGRVQGLEKLVEKFFGPNGYFNPENTKELMDNKRQTAENYISPFDTLFKTPDDRITGSMYMKMFGNEIKYMGMNSDDFAEMQEFNILDFLIKLAEPKKLDLTRNFQFLDTSVIIPTAIGLPMNLTANGTASVNIDMDGKIDLRNVGASPRALDINGYIKPSAAVVVSGIMGIDAIVTKSSMKMVATMHTSTQLNGKIQLLNGEVFNVEMNIPQEKMEIIHVQSEFLMNGKKMEMPAAETNVKRCTPESMTQIIGVEMCADLTLPATSKSGLPLPPFTGPMNAQITIEKKDTHTGYIFTTKYMKERERLNGNTFIKRTALMTFDTPGSKVDRKLSTELIFDPAKMSIDASIINPWKKLSWSASATNTEILKKAKAMFIIDEDKEYSIDAELGITQKRVKTVYSPKLTISMPNIPTKTVAATFEAGTGKTLFGADVKISKFTTKPISLKASITKAKGTGYDTELNLKSDLMNADLTGNIGMSAGVYSCRTAFIYTIQNRPEHRFTISGKFSDKSQGELMSYTAQAGFITTEYPELGFTFDGKHQMTKSSITTSTKLYHGTNKDLIAFTHSSSKEGPIENLTVDSKTTLTCPAMGIDVSADLKHRHSQGTLNSSLTVGYAPGKNVRAAVKLGDKMATENMMEAAIELSYPGRDMKLNTDYNKLANGEYKHNLNAQWGNDNQEMNVASSLKTGETYEATSEIKMPGYPITVTASIKPNLKDFMARGDVTYKRTKYAAETSYKYEPNMIRADAEMTLPSRKMVYNLELTKGDTTGSATTEIQWDAERDETKKVKLEGEYHFRGTTAAPSKEILLTATLPKGAYATRMYMDHNDKTRNVEVTLTLAGERNEFTASWDKTNASSGRASLDSPFIRYDGITKLETTWTVTKTPSEISNSIELSWHPQAKITQSASYKITSTSAAVRFDVTTPFTEASRLGFELDTRKGATCVTKAKAYNNNDEFTLDYTHTGYSTASLTMAGHGCEMSASFDATNEDTITAEVTYTWDAENKVWTKIILKKGANKSINVDMTSPFEIKKLSANINHDGVLSNFHCRSSLSWNDKRIDSNVNFTPKKADIDITSPWRTMSANYNLNGDLEAMTADAAVQWAADKKITSEATFNRDAKTMSFKLNTPYTEEISGEFTPTLMTVTWAPGKTVTATGTYSMANGYSAEGTLSTPFDEAKDIRLTARHTGDISAWDSSVTLTINEMRPIQVYSSRSEDKKQSVMIGMKNIPNEHLKQWELLAEHKLFSTKTSTRFTASWNKNQKIYSRVIYTFKGQNSIEASLETPYTPDMKAELKHKGNFANFENSALFSWEPTKAITLFSQLDTRTGMSFKSGVTSPWKQITFNMMKSGTLMDFSGNADLTWDQTNTIKSSIQFSSHTQVTGKVTLETPFEMVRTAEAKLTHTGSSYKKFNNAVELSVNGKEATLGTVFDITSGFELKVNSVNPWQSFSTMIKQTGTIEDLTCEASYEFGEQTFDGKFEFALNDNVVAKLELKNPTFYKPIIVSANLGLVNNKVAVTWGDSKTITADTNFDMSNGISATATFTTPFTGYESGNGKLTHTGDWTNFRNSAEATFQGKTFKLESDFTHSTRTTGHVTMTAPWNTYTASVNHSGDMREFSNDADVEWASGKKITFNSKWSMNRGINAEVSIATPFENFETMKAAYNHQERNKELTAHAEASIGAQRISSDLTFKMTPSILAEISVSSPWKTFSAKYTHQGTYSERCNAFAELKWDQETMSADWSISMSNGFKVEMNVNSPWRNFAAEIKHTGPWTNVDQVFSVTYGTGKTIRLENEFRWLNDMSAKATLSTPFKNGEISITHSGTKEHFTCNLAAEYDHIPVTGELSWNARSGYRSTVGVNTPWRNIVASFNTNDDLMNLDSDASFKWSSDEQIDATLKFSASHGAITINTPWRDVAANFHHAGDRTDFTSSAELSWETGKKIETELKFDQNPLSGSWTINSPWRNLASSFEHAGEMASFRSSADFSWEADKKIESSIYFRQSPLNGGVIINTPWRDMSIKMEQTGELSNMRAEAELSWETGKKIKTAMTFQKSPMSASCTINTPWRDMAASFSKTGDMTDMSAQTTLSWETGKQIKMEASFVKATYAATLSLETPWQNFAAEMAHTGHEANNLNCSYEVSWGPTDKIRVELVLDRRSDITGKVDINTPWKNISVNLRHSGEYNKYESHADLSWETGKEYSTDVLFTIEPVMFEWAVSTPEQTYKAKLTHQMTDSTVDSTAEFIWSPSDKIDAAFNLKSVRGFEATTTLKTPWRNMSAEMTYDGGDYDNFTGTSKISWEDGRTVTSEIKFTMVEYISAEAKLTTPYTEDWSANLRVDGTKSDFRGSADVQWAPTKKMATSGSFKMVDTITGEVELTTPFTEKWSAEFEHTGGMEIFNNNAEITWAPNMKITIDAKRTATNGDITLTTPFTEPLKAKFQNFEDAFNWDATFQAVGKEIKAETRWNMENGYNGSWKITTTFPELSEAKLIVNYNGNPDNAVHVTELTWNDEYIKSTITLNRAGNTYSEVIETTFEGFEKIEFSAEGEKTETSFSAKVMAARNADKYEANVSGDVDYEKIKITSSGRLEIKTPLAGYESNVINAEIKFSQRLMNVKFDGFLGDATNHRTFEFYSMTRGKGGEMYAKSNLYSGDEESRVDVKYTMEENMYTLEVSDDIKPLEHKCNSKWTINHEATPSGLNHSGEFEFNYQGVAHKVEWNAASNSNMCETGFSYTKDSQTMVNYSHKTTWNSAYSDFEHSMSYKCSIYDLGFNMKYNFTAEKKTGSLTMFNDPHNPWDFKMEARYASDIDITIEMSTPFVDYKTMKSTLLVQKASQPWTVSLTCSLNGQTVTATGNVKYNGVEDMEGNLSFTSPIPMFKNLQFTIKNAKLQDTWRPNMSVQWANDKKIDLSGTLQWVDQYKATLELMTPFECMRSLVTDFSFSNATPRFEGEFSFKINKMARKLTGNFAFNMETKSVTVSMSSPWEVIRSMELSAAMTPRMSASINYNDENVFTLSGNGSWTNWASNNIDVSLSYPFWNKNMNLKMNTDLSLDGDNSMLFDVEFEYMRGQKLTMKYTHHVTTNHNIEMVITSPFIDFERIKYNVVYTGKVDDWTENSVIEGTWGKFTTSTTFSLKDGISYHQSITGKWRGDDYTHQEDFVFNGDTKKFELDMSMSGTAVPSMSLTTNWQLEPTKLNLKATMNKYSVEYTHEGSMNDFTCTYKVVLPAAESMWGGEVEQTYNGHWTVNVTDKLTFDARFVCPHNDVTFNFDSSWTSGNVEAKWKVGRDDWMRYDGSFSRTSSPFSYKGDSRFTYDTDSFGVDVELSATKLTFLTLYNQMEIVGLRATNIVNADNEYEPHITLKLTNTDGQVREYKFDGLFKNEGEGLVRDFKLHINGPRGYESGFNFQLNFRTQSSQLVPGDAMFHLGFYDNGEKERVITHLNASWGNDHVLVEISEPTPQKYSMEFSVSTSGMNGEIVCNWDTSATDKSFKLNFENKCISYSRRLKHMLDIDLEYLGVSRGFKSDLDWQTDSFNHKLSVDYNGKEVGYNMQLNHSDGCVDTLEVMTPWRSVKTTWTKKPVSEGFDLSYDILWDSKRDPSKKFSGHSQLVKLATHSYKWTSTVSHPALSKDIKVIDTITYDTTTTLFDFKKEISFSTDPKKDITFEMSALKNGKWGVALKQEFNNIDIHFGTEYSKSSNAAFSNTMLRYKGTDGRMKNIEMNMKYNVAAKTYTFEFVSPMKTIKVKSENTSLGQGACTHQIKVTVDGQVYKAFMNYKPAESYLQIQFEFDPMNSQNFINFEAKKLPAGYQVKLIKQQDGETTIEGLAAFNLNENKTFNTKLFWNPSAYAEVKEKINSLRGEIKSMASAMHSATTNEASQKVSSIQLGNDFDQIMPYHETEFDILKRDAQRFKNHMGRAYEKDIMGMKTIGEATSVYVESMTAEFKVVKEKIINFYTEFIQPYAATIGEDVERMNQQLAEKLAEIEMMFEDFDTEELEKLFNAIKMWMQGYYDVIAEYTTQHPSMDSIRKFHSNTMGSFNQYSSIAANKLQGMTDPTMYAPYMDKATQYMASTLSSEKITEAADLLKDKMAFYYHYYDVADNTQIFIRHCKNIAASYMDYWLTHFVDETFNDLKWVTYQPENGRIEFELTIPTQFADIDFAEFKEEIRESIYTVVEHMADYHFNMRELFYMYKPRHIGQILPPYEAHAMIAGQHIRTFDRRHYDFQSGQCSYLLARDFVDGNFTIYVNYQDDEQSVIVHTNGRTVDIMQDNTVKMDNGKIELPVQFYNTSIKRVGHTISIENSLGVKVVCDNKHGLCTVVMSGFYFAKTGGLFGTYNNEPLDDFTTSDNKNETDVTAFANSWANSCQGTNTARSFTPVKDTKEYNACAAIFMDGASAMETCFDIVDPEPFFHKCVNDMSKAVTLTEKNGPCKAAVFYKAECQRAGVTVSEPSHCVTCELGNTMIERGQSRQLPTTVNAADVVIVIEEKRCNFDTDKKLPMLAKLIEAALINKKYSDIRFGLVGFGGEAVHDPAHMHTIGSQEFSSAKEFHRGTSALAFGSGENKDVFEAVHFAAQYPFRAGASKVIVVVPCSDCSDSVISSSFLIDTLKIQDVAVHMIQDFTFKLINGGRNPSTNYLFGIDNKAVFSMRDAGTLKGNTKLFSTVSMPKDQCSYLALQTGGTVFDLNMMVKYKPYTNKKFQTVFANRMAKTTTPSSCQICSCEYNQVFMEARTVCKTC